MKAKYLIFSVVMTAVMLVVAWAGNFVYRWITHTPFSLDAITLSLVIWVIVMFFYQVAEKNDKED